MSNWSVFTKFFTIILVAVRMFINGVGAGAGTGRLLQRSVF